VGGVFDVAPGFLASALDLVDDAGVGEAIIADSFADTLLHCSNDLIGFALDLVRIHNEVPLGAFIAD
jgi:hypothetical protein